MTSSCPNLSKKGHFSYLRDRMCYRNFKLSIENNLRMRNSKIKSALQYFENLVPIVTSSCPNLGKKGNFSYLHDECARNIKISILTILRMRNIKMKSVFNIFKIWASSWCRAVIWAKRRIFHICRTEYATKIEIFKKKSKYLKTN